MSLLVGNVVAELDAFVSGTSKVQRTLDRITQHLRELDVDCALAGALAVGVQGHLRATVDVDLIVTAEGLARFKSNWLGRGYVEKFPGSRGVRDVETGVSIDFLVAGEYPGDGRPKPVRFPDPSTIPLGEDHYRVLDLRSLIELKLASGISARDRLQDLADVIALIRVHGLADAFRDRLDESVREKYLELWSAAQQPHER